jgi:hypothetical protein
MVEREATAVPVSKSVKKDFWVFISSVMTIRAHPQWTEAWRQGDIEVTLANVGVAKEENPPSPTNPIAKLPTCVVGTLETYVKATFLKT